jgi:hypothetical protein
MLSRRNYFWSEAEDAKLRAFAQNGVYVRNIAIRLKRTPTGVRRRAKQLGLSLPSRPRGPLSARRQEHADVLKIGYRTMDERFQRLLELTERILRDLEHRIPPEVTTTQELRKLVDELRAKSKPSAI